MKIKFSIITVSFNCAKTIKETIKSVLNQDYNNFEYIVIDGDSTDNTVSVLKQFEPLFKAKDITFKWISERDKGIYDAMNKGIRLASGTWLNFMNVGDTFANSDVLKTVDVLLTSNLALVYGTKIQETKIIEPHPLNILEKGIIMACHQAMFFNKAILKDDLRYDCRYKIYSDYDLVNRIYLKYKPLIEYINLPIAIYQGGGISAKPSYQKRKDKYTILLKNYGIIGLFKGLFYKFTTR